MSKPKIRGLLLSIDDEQMVCEVITSLAATTGFNCLQAGTPAEIKTALDQNPDVIVLDMTMPDMDGIEVIWELKRRKSKASLIISSGFDSAVISAAEQIAANSDLRCVKRLDKPFDAETMLGIFEELLEGLDISAPPN
ncbi:MAG: response regulator [Azonexus sp.]|nr:response regulator [Azonexus sp.]